MRVAGRDTASVRAPLGVVNLSEVVSQGVIVDHDSTCMALGTESARRWSCDQLRCLEVDEHTLAGDSLYESTLAKLQDYNWNFGQTPIFTATADVPIGHAETLLVGDETDDAFELVVTVKRGVIESIALQQKSSDAAVPTNPAGNRMRLPPQLTNAAVQLLEKELLGSPFVQESFAKSVRTRELLIEKTVNLLCASCHTRRLNTWRTCSW